MLAIFCHSAVRLGQSGFTVCSKIFEQFNFEQAAEMLIPAGRPAGAARALINYRTLVYVSICGPRDFTAP